MSFPLSFPSLFLLILLLALSLAPLSLSSMSGPLRTRANHVGALNRRLRHEVELVRSGRPSSSSPAAPAQYFTQSTDHFDPNSVSTFQQKYYVNSTFFQPGGPIFFLLGGEGALTPAYVGGHFIVNTYAQKFSGLIVSLEHRFYGSSIPNNSSSTDNLRFLSSQQALADAAVFASQFSSSSPSYASSPWIVVGGSYSGALSAWARLKYPHIFAGSIAASAPVEAILDFSQYFQVDQRSMGSMCSAIISDSTVKIDALLASGNAGALQALSTQFNTCTPIKSLDSNDQMMFAGGISNPFAEIIQYNLDNRGPGVTNISSFCSQLEIDAKKKGSVQAVADFVLSQAGNQCMEISYSEYIQEMQPTSDGRSWTYQTCREFGYFQTAESSTLQPFSPLITLNSFLQQCQDIFKVPGMTPNIAWTNEDYGSLKMSTSNTFFTNGFVDPWSSLGEAETAILGNSNGVIVMPHTAHCADLYTASPYDLPELTYTREVQLTFLTEWLAGVQAPA